MQRVTNCILINNDHVLVLKKPRRGWYAIPGGKMEQGESIKESVTREYNEETALTLMDPQLAGVFTFNIFEQETFIQEWMMFTFICRQYTGELTKHCKEGELEWVPVNRVCMLPMAEGDRLIFKHVLQSNDMLYGSFHYTTEYELLDMRLDPFVSVTSYEGDAQ
ncbi:NUDIX domain-containing protein [Virgibacillus dakarensis]|uniref:Nudix hydrolase YvcI n=1 Tax=Lentibacillus populi TaxID=1827502 RepID=A0A9W5X6Q9_9BACI|nr:MULTISPECIES: 8-oxo-dGTP diphosphatase [Bacillaceae]MTW86345.1 NUDIX domain-containing protein [Virgibacillus dakarensis]GGB53960.1 putative Nudix hydrolase YvcI [Lentibacillus populi]